MAEVPFKATAGLHHAVRAHQPSVDAKQFGFLNVFLGASLLYTDAIDERALGEILAEEDPNAFAAEETWVGWRDRRLGIEALAEARSRFCHSFGSCSFDEPMEELARLGWRGPQTAD